ncbi:MAG: class B sortase [Clostridia bacterium]|nr:class B sortase [Clostridia bacterium]
MAKKKINIGYIILIVVIILMAVVGIGAFVLNNIFSNRSLEKPGQELGFDIFIGDENAAVTTSVEENRNLSEELKAINVTYKDAVAWLKVPGTSIDYPIFQGTDNTRYYREDRDGVTKNWGENYLDYRCNINNLSQEMTNIIIYGHNTETDNRFTPLLDYKRQEFYNTHKYIELATQNGTYTYEIFTAYTTDTKFYYIDTVFADKAEYGEFIEDIAKKSRYGTGVEVTADDTILTLSTCDYSIKDGRFVVQARLVKNP